MDTSFYPDSVIENFIKTNLCHSDRKLYNHYLNGDVAKFRERISRKYPATADKKIEQVVYACITDSIRDIILKTVGRLTERMYNCGDLVITGGEAFNMYFDKESRIITSDIDTKFIPVFKGPSGGLITTKSPKYFGFLQSVKLRLWDEIGQSAKYLNKKIKQRIEKVFKGTKIARFLGISFPAKGPWVTRRYTLIQKKRHDFKSDQVKLEDVLIDVELFALDLKLRYYSVENKRITNRNLGGILDIAIMRPFEVGYEVAFTRNQGIMYFDKDKDKMVADKRILFAGRRFLVEDVYLMQQLGLRPQKAAKDKKRMFTFAKQVLGIRSVQMSDPLDVIFKKSIRKLGDSSKGPSIKKRPVFKLEYSRFNPKNYSNFTTPPKPGLSYQLVGLKAPRGLTMPGFALTSGPFRFNVEKKKWITNTNPYYIKNEANFRATEKMKVQLRLMNALYGFSSNRNAWMPPTLINKSAMIPLVGLKNTSFIFKNDLRKAQKTSRRSVLSQGYQG